MDDLAKQILKDLNLEEIAPRVQKRSSVDHWAPAVLLERAAYLRKMARFGDGSASEAIREYPQYSVMLSFRSRNSEAEVHQSFACLFYVMAGAATLVTGGTVNGARSVEFGEMRGNTIENGASQELRQGDFAHIPAGVPHQMLVAGDKSITCLVVRIQDVQ